MQPAMFKGLTISQENNAVKVQDSLSYRMQDVVDQERCYVIAGKEDKESARVACTQDNKKVHIWLDGFGDILHQKSIYYAGSPQTGYQTKTGGVVLGVDGHFAKYFYAGVLGSYTDSNTHCSVSNEFKRFKKDEQFSSFLKAISRDYKI